MDPVAWVGSRLADLDGLLAEVRFDPAALDPADAAEAREAVPEILAAVRRLIERIRRGELGVAPPGDGGRLAGGPGRLAVVARRCRILGSSRQWA